MRPSLEFASASLRTGSCVVLLRLVTIVIVPSAAHIAVCNKRARGSCKHVAKIALAISPPPPLSQPAGLRLWPSPWAPLHKLPEVMWLRKCLHEHEHEHLPLVSRFAWSQGDQKETDLFRGRTVNCNGGPFGGHHLGGDSCPPTTFEVVPS